MSHPHEVANSAPRIAMRGGETATADRDLPGGDWPAAHAASRHGAFWWLLHGLAWCGIIVLLAVALLHIFYHDGNYTLASLNAFTRYVYLPAYFCLAWAGWQRRWLLAIVSIAVIGCHVKWISRDFVRDARFDAPASAAAATDRSQTEAKTLRIFYANVCADNPDPATYIDEISTWNPDIVVFVEFYHHWHDIVTTHPALKPYPYGTARTMNFVTEVGLFSKLPIAHPKQYWTAGRLNLTFDLNIDGRPLRFFVLHSPRPMELPMHDYKGFWEKTIPQIESQPDPTIVLGDFNATQYSKVFQTLTADRLRSAHEDRGRGWATTWPNGEEPLPPIRIDQALLSAGVECVDITEGRGIGSDHKPLILDIRLRPEQPRVETTVIDSTPIAAGRSSR